MDKIALVARILLGLLFFVFGLNGFLDFLPQPELPAPAQDFIGGLVESGYFWPLLKTTETICGLLLLIGRFVPLALTVLAPVVVNIIAFHLAFAPGGILPGLIALLLGLFLAWCYRASFRSVLDPNAKPAS